MSVNVPPRVELSWTATALGAAFGGYRVYRRPARNPVFPWALVGKLDTPAGYTPAVVEAQHTRWIDYEPGWSFLGGQWQSGWDYAVTVINGTTGFESAKVVVSSVPIVPDSGYWATSNIAPYYNFPLAVVTDWASNDEQGGMWVDRAAGRDLALVRTAAELPARLVDLHYDDFARMGEDGIRTWRAAQAAGITMTVLTVRGDRIIGALYPPKKGGHDTSGVVHYDGALVETIREPNYVPAQYNLPCGLALNGTTMFAGTPDLAVLNPAGAFTILVAFRLASSAAVKGLLCKGDVSVASTQGYGVLKTAADVVKFGFKGVTTAGSITGTRVVGNNLDHCVIAESSGAAQALFVDGVADGVAAVTHGAITIAQPLNTGVDNNGTLFAPLNPVYCWAYWPRLLSATEKAQATGDALMWPNMRMPPGASYFVDLRDQRTWSGAGAITDQSGNALVTNLTAAPPTVGIPWPLASVDRF